MVMMVALEFVLHLDMSKLFFGFRDHVFEFLPDFEFIFARNYSFTFGGKYVRHIHPKLLSRVALFLALSFQLCGIIIKWIRLVDLYLINFYPIYKTFLNRRTLHYVVPLILSTLLDFVSDDVFHYGDPSTIFLLYRF